MLFTNTLHSCAYNSLDLTCTIPNTSLYIRVPLAERVRISELEEAYYLEHPEEDEEEEGEEGEDETKEQEGNTWNPNQQQLGLTNYK